MKSILLLALSAIILSQSYGFVYADHEGNSHANFQVASQASEVAIITIETDSSSYVEGEVITVSGSVSDFRESDPYTNFDVTIRLIAPNNNIVSISQVSLDDGFYSTSILAQGPLWKLDGDYTISVSWGSDNNASTTFTFISEPEEIIEEVEQEEVIEISEEELAEVVEETETPEPTSVSTGSAPAADFNALTYSIVFTVAIAFGIMIILYAVSRGSRTKTA